MEKKTQIWMFLFFSINVWISSTNLLRHYFPLPLWISVLSLILALVNIILLAIIIIRMIKHRKMVGRHPALDEDIPVKHSDFPSWDEIMKYMQDKELSALLDTVVNVLSSKDLSKRILILQSESGYYTVLYEEIRVYTPDEWAHFCHDANKYPAWWEPVYSSSLNTASFYGTMEEAMQVITNSYEYKMYFE